MFLTSSPTHLLQPQQGTSQPPPLAIGHLRWGLEAQEERDTALQGLTTANELLSILILQASLCQPPEPSVSTTHIEVAQSRTQAGPSEASVTRDYTGSSQPRASSTCFKKPSHRQWPGGLS